MEGDQGYLLRGNDTGRRAEQEATREVAQRAARHSRVGGLRVAGATDALR